MMQYTTLIKLTFFLAVSFSLLVESLRTLIFKPRCCELNPCPIMYKKFEADVWRHLVASSDFLKVYVGDH